MIDLNAHNLSVYDYLGLLRPGDMYCFVARSRLRAGRNTTRQLLDAKQDDLVFKLVLSITISNDEQNNKIYRVNFVNQGSKQISHLNWRYETGKLISNALIVLPAPKTGRFVSISTNGTNQAKIK